jgi:hypothetical protein
MIDNLFSYEKRQIAGLQKCRIAFFQCQLKITLGNNLAGTKIARIDINWMNEKLELYRTGSEQYPEKFPIKVIV